MFYSPNTAAAPRDAIWMRRPSRPTGREDRRTRCCQAKTVRTLPPREAGQPALRVPAAEGDVARDGSARDPLS